MPDRMKRSLKWSVLPGALPAWVAEMDFAPAPAIIEALEQAVHRESLGYPSPALYSNLRKAFAKYLGDRRGWQIEDGDCLVFTDVLRVYAALVGTLPPEKSICVLSPCYAPLRELPRALGRRVIEVPLSLDDGCWTLPMEVLHAALATGPGLLVIVNPHNPTGKMFSEAELRTIAESAHAFGVPVFADEVYEPLAPNGRHVPFGLVAGDASHVTVLSAGKAWNISGLRCCQVIANKWTVLADIEKAIGGGASSLGIVASTAAYTHGMPWLTDISSRIGANTARAVERLHRFAGHVRPPDAGYLLWLKPDLRCRCAVETHFVRSGLVVTAGREFGPSWDGWVRLNLACEPRTLDAILDRFEHAATDPCIRMERAVAST